LNISTPSIEFGAQNSNFPVSNWLFIGFPFAKLLRNKTQNFSFFAHQFCAKKQQFAQSKAKVISCKIALFRFCETQIKNQTVGDGVCFLEFNSGKILFWNVFLLVTFT